MNVKCWLLGHKWSSKKPAEHVANCGCSFDGADDRCLWRDYYECLRCGVIR